MKRTPQLLTPRGGIAELAKLINAEAHDDIRIVNAHDDDRQGLNCLEMSDRLIQSSIYVDESFGKNIKYVTVTERMFDIPPDIEVLQ